MDGRPVDRLVILSNISLGIMIFSELLFLMYFIMLNFFESLLGCCCLILGIITLILMFIPAILLSVLMFSSRIKGPMLRKVWIGGAILIAIGCLSILMGLPVLPLFLLVALYAAIFPLMSMNGRILLIMSAVLFAIGLTGSIVSLFFDHIIAAVFFCAMIVLMMISHCMLILCNNMAIKSWDRLTSKEVDEKAKTTEGPFIEKRPEPDVEDDIISVERPIEDISWAHDEGSDVKETEKGRKERVRDIKPPAGFTFPIDE